MDHALPSVCLDAIWRIYPSDGILAAGMSRKVAMKIRRNSCKIRPPDALGRLAVNMHFELFFVIYLLKIVCFFHFYAQNDKKIPLSKIP